MGSMLLRVVLPVSGLEASARFYQRLLLIDGYRQSPACHCFQLGQVVLACYDAEADGEEALAAAPHPIYLAVDETLTQLRVRAQQMGAQQIEAEPRRLPSGETGLMLSDPWGNRLCLVDSYTMQWGSTLLPAPRSAPQDRQGMMVFRQDFLNAVKGGEFARVKELLALDPNLLETCDASGASVLLLAAYKKHERIAAYLLALREDLTIHEAAAMGVSDELSQLLRRHPDHVNKAGPDGFLPLGLAAYFGRGECVELLLQAHADVHATSRNHLHAYPLNSALTNIQEECALGIVHRLLRAGASPNAAQVSGHTALHQAAGRGFAQLVDLLLAAGADPHARADNGATPGELARRGGFQNVLGRFAAFEAHQLSAALVHNRH